MTVISRSPEDIGGVGQRSLLSFDLVIEESGSFSVHASKTSNVRCERAGDIGEMSAAAARILTFAAAAPVCSPRRLPQPCESNQHRQEQRDRPTMKLWLIVSLPLHILDQTTKALVLQHISTNEMLPIIPGVFNRINVQNTGAAFGMLKDNNLFFIALSARLDRSRGSRTQRRLYRLGSRWAAALLMSVAGNLTDRIRYGYVVDFLDVILPWCGRWPVQCGRLLHLHRRELFILGAFLDSKRKNIQPSLS